MPEKRCVGREVTVRGTPSQQRSWQQEHAAADHTAPKAGGREPGLLSPFQSVPKYRPWNVLHTLNVFSLQSDLSRTRSDTPNGMILDPDKLTRRASTQLFYISNQGQNQLLESPCAVSQGYCHLHFRLNFLWAGRPSSGFWPWKGVRSP